MKENRPPEDEHQHEQPERVEDKQELRELKEREERANLFARHVEVQRTSWDTQFEITKHTSAGSGVLLLGLGALVGVFLPSPSVPWVAALGVVLLVVSFLISLAELVLVRNIVLYQMGEDTLEVFYYGNLIREGIQPDEEQEKALQEQIQKSMEELPGLGLRSSTTLWTVVHWATLLTVCGGAICFLVFALYNLIGCCGPSPTLIFVATPHAPRQRSKSPLPSRKVPKWFQTPSRDQVELPENALGMVFSARPIKIPDRA